MVLVDLVVTAVKHPVPIMSAEDDEDDSNSTHHATPGDVENIGVVKSNTTPEIQEVKRINLQHFTASKDEQSNDNKVVPNETNSNINVSMASSSSSFDATEGRPSRQQYPNNDTYAADTEQLQQQQPNIILASSSTMTATTTASPPPPLPEDEARDEEEEETFYGSRTAAWNNDNDPYVYSDDSASLSDAYFFPQPSDDEHNSNNNNRPFYLRFFRTTMNNNDETDSLTGNDTHGQPQHPGGATTQHLHYPLASYYGSISTTNYGQQQQQQQQHHHASQNISSTYQHGVQHHTHPTVPASAAAALMEQRANSPLWLTAGSIQAIQEDSEEIILMNNQPPLGSSGMQATSALAGGAAGPKERNSWLLKPDTSSRMSGVMLRKERRRQRRLKREWMQQQQQLQQQKRENRERAVNQVRGRPQDNGKVKDVEWALLFLIQFVSICFCAGYFGSSLFAQEQMEMDWTHYLPSPLAGNNFHHWDGDDHRKKFQKIHNEAPTQNTFALSPSNKQTEENPVPSILVHNPTTDELQYDETLLTKNETSKIASGTAKSPSMTTTDVVSALNAEVTGSNSDNDMMTVTTDTIGETTDNVESSSVSFTIDYQNVVALISMTGFYACALSSGSFVLMLILARAVIQIMLIFSIVLALTWGMIGLSLDPYGAISILGFTALLLTLGYAMYHWQRIPFAATNLFTALCALRCTIDVVFLGLCGLIVSFAWSMIWGVAFMGIVNTLNNDECIMKNACEPHVALEHVPFYLLLLLSYHWTNTVIKNVLSVTVASVVGTWWFYPGDIGCLCTAAVAKPLFRALTKSLGSICLGSLIVQPVQIFTTFVNWFYFLSGNSESSSCISASVDHTDTENSKPTDKKSQQSPYNQNTLNNRAVLAPNNLSTDDDEALTDLQHFVFCCRRVCCFREQINAMLRGCNRWSYTYIGMYGYAFADAGALALKLFETREWLDVVKDGLIQEVLIMASIMIGGSTGTFAVVVEESDGYDFSTFHKPVLSAFIIGSVIGYVLSNILLLGVVGSAVNTVLVCFAAGPFEFDKNHPKLSREMREVWSQQVWEQAD